MKIEHALELDPTALMMVDVDTLSAEELEAHLVKEVSVHGDYREIYKHLTWERPIMTGGAVQVHGKEVQDFDLVNLTEERDALYVDGEGLLTQPQHFMTVKGYGQPLAGKGLILGGDDEGESIDTTLDRAWVLDNVAFGWLNYSYTHERGLEILAVHHLVHWKGVLPWLKNLNL